MSTLGKKPKQIMKISDRLGKVYIAAYKRWNLSGAKSDKSLVNIVHQFVDKHKRLKPRFEKEVARAQRRDYKDILKVANAI